MILLVGKNPMGNVLHVIQGPESAFWHEVHGSSALDITPLLQKMDQTQPVFLHVSNTESEQDTAMQLQSLISAGGVYPFSVPHAVFAPNSLVDTPTPDLPDDSQRAVVEPDPPKHANSGCMVAVCSRCKDMRAPLVPGLAPAICYACVEIDLRIAAKKKDEGTI